jgi:Spy/CpxP family protein refolding chaperone
MALRLSALVALPLALVFTPALAAEDHRHHSPAASATPYAGLEARPIKALSAEDQAGLLAGQGMGMALAAELNGYPGPRHVLDMADDLALSPHQRHQTSQAFDEMKGEATALGSAVIAAEEELDRLFASGSATPTSVMDATAKVAGLSGQLRALHLGYHLRMRAILSAEQVAIYNKLRGYSLN